jgi:hypothetical protein
VTTFADIAPTTAKLLRLLASDNSGEVIASVHALRRVLGSANLDLHDLATWSSSSLVAKRRRSHRPSLAMTTRER